MRYTAAHELRPLQYAARGKLLPDAPDLLSCFLAIRALSVRYGCFVLPAHVREQADHLGSLLHHLGIRGGSYICPVVDPPVPNV